MSEETPLLVSNDLNSKRAQKVAFVATDDNDEMKSPSDSALSPRYPARQQSHVRYKSSAVHLPKYIQESNDFGREHDLASVIPTAIATHNKSVKSVKSVSTIAMVDDDEMMPDSRLDKSTQKMTAFIPLLQFGLLWSTALLFSASLIFALLGIVVASGVVSDVLAMTTAAVLIVVSVCGLAVSYSYRSTLHALLRAHNKILDVATKHKLAQINEDGADDDAQQNQRDGGKRVSLLQSFIRGNFAKQLAVCDTQELKQLLPVVAQSLCNMPFGLTEFRSALFVVLADRISHDASLDQAWRFFLNCNRDIAEIQRTWENHEYLQPESSSGSAQDSVAFFRSILKETKIGARKTCDRKAFLCDPINGNLLCEVQLSRIMPSNARPYLLDLYTKERGTGSAVLSSKVLLKSGDDLRKDLGVLLMFKFMNELWKNINFNGQICEAMVYSVIPMATDFGVIEFIEGASKIAEIDEVIGRQKDVLSSAQYQRLMDTLVATSAASYVAAYVLGIRDRHFDNILVTNEGQLFHIDFAYILGETLSGLDASKIAITSKFVKTLGTDSWLKFLEVVVILFSLLRRHYVELIDYARVVFAFMQQADNDKYIAKALMMELDESDASKKIKSLFERAPNAAATKVKNVMHALATKNKS